MSDQYQITPKYSWRPLSGKYLADIELSILANEDGLIPTAYLSPLSMMDEPMSDSWGWLVIDSRKRSIELQATSLAEVQSLAKETIASIREQLDATARVNRESALACEMLNAVERSSD